MNVELLRRVQRHILEEPNRLNMGSWIRLRGAKALPEPFYDHLTPACGTVACIAGWAVVLGRYNGDASKYDEYMAVRRFRDRDVTLDVSELAVDLLDIDPSDSEQLFHVGEWPEDLYNAYLATSRVLEPERAQRRAALTAERIDRFIAERS